MRSVALTNITLGFTQWFATVSSNITSKKLQLVRALIKSHKVSIKVFKKQSGEINCLNVGIVGKDTASHLITKLELPQFGLRPTI